MRYFAERDGLVPEFLPEPPVDLSLVHDEEGELRLSWAPGAVGAPWGDAPDGYLVETQQFRDPSWDARPGPRSPSTA